MPLFNKVQMEKDKTIRDQHPVFIAYKWHQKYYVSKNVGVIYILQSLHVLLRGHHHIEASIFLNYSTVVIDGEVWRYAKRTYTKK